MTVSPVVGAVAGTYLPPPPAPPPAGETSGSFGYGSLSPRQLATLRAATGYDFNWPSTPDSGLFPLSAVFVANHNLADPLMAGKPLTVDTLKALAAAGLMDAAGVAGGVALLRGQSPANSAADGDSRARRYPHFPVTAFPAAAVGDAVSVPIDAPPPERPGPARRGRTRSAPEVIRTRRFS